MGVPRTDALGWKALFPLQRPVRPLQPAALLARRLGISALSQLPFWGAVWNRWWYRNIQPDETVHTRRVDRAGSEFDILWQTCRSDRQISAIRDSAGLTGAMSKHLRLNIASCWPSGGATGRRLRLPFTRNSRPANWGSSRNCLCLRAICWRAIHSWPGHCSSSGQRALRRQSHWPSRTPRFPVPFWARWLYFQLGFLQGIFGSPDPALPMDTVRDPQNWCMAGGDFDII